LDESVVLLHIDADDFSIRREKHLEVFAFGGCFLKVHNKESITGRDALSAFVLFTPDSTIASSELNSETVRYSLNPPVLWNGRDGMVKNSVEEGV
jgi:hypothetical protein